ncbi:NAD(P)H-hydrate epimerase [Candidatus Woesearchaeota archaeon]|nr:NAD(P)H-hydrate epimerase [Candidatus Woesearchaeota archaeon]
MITTEEMKQLEDNCGISKLQLMENAGRGIADIIKNRFKDLKDKNILFVCYHGNNGGDGFAAARHLSDFCEVDVLFIGDESRLKDEANTNYRRVLNNEKIQLLFDFEDIDFDAYDIIVDSILGIGVEGNLKEPIGDVVDNFNRSKAFKISIDIPTGLNPDNGVIADKAVNPDLIITMHDLKPGLEKFKDKTAIVDIGI